MSPYIYFETFKCVGFFFKDFTEQCCLELKNYFYFEEIVNVSTSSCEWQKQYNTLTSQCWNIFKKKFSYEYVTVVFKK